MQRFEAMRDELVCHGVEVIALSKDSVSESARHKQRDGLSMKLLCDPELEVIRQYGVEHHKGIEYSTVPFTLLGLSLALIPRVKAMAIPTTLLIENGVVRWIDQTDDYRLRSNEERVRAAVETTLET